ncbi:NAD-dependent protein deacylase [Arhodomonas sp. AD133]|uniref:NAD-dependent protein deacylase n=1 Tax=Arhodomonas sp. AD133 TaxID=3415009 RepID=UPI003EB99DD4
MTHERVWDADDRQRLTMVAEQLTAASRVLAITGAGLSADSGLPTYRGIGGLYEQRSTDHGMPIEAALSGEVFVRQPETTWQYLRELGAAARGARPNAGHYALSAFETGGREVCVLTQNVDGLHRAAGSRKVVEIHGNMQSLVCTQCRYRRSPVDYAELPPLPSCPECFAPLRPPVVLFGEMLPDDALRELRRELTRGFDLVLCIGTSGLFPYITEPVHVAGGQGIPVVEINPGVSAVSDAVDIRLARPAAETLAALQARLP